MSKVLLANTYFYRFDAKQWADQKPYPPYGTIYAAALLRQEKYEVQFFDTNLRESPDEIIPLLEEQADYLVLYDDGFNYLSKMCLTAMRDAAFRMIQLAKTKVKKILICSSDSSDHYEKYLEAGADYVMLGEGELTLKELLFNLEQNEEAIPTMLGIAFNDGKNIVKNTRRPILKDLDILPTPAWDLIDIESYKSIWVNSHGYFSLNIATTRGCPYKCNWCAKPIYGNRYNSRSPKRVAEEMEMMVKEFGAQHFWVCDDIFGLKPGWVQSFRDEVQSRNLNLKYKIQSRADLLLKEDNIEALAQSGLDTVWIGAESGSQKILDAMDKGTKVEQIHEATRLLKKKGVKVGFFLQFGYLDETKEDIQSTIQMLLELMPDDIGISVSYPLPGTGFYEKVKDQLKVKQNWTDSDDLAMMYKANFSAAFYKRLHRLVHKLFRKKQGLQKLKSLLNTPSEINKKSLRSVLATLYYIPAAEVDRFRLRQLESQE